MRGSRKFLFFILFFSSCFSRTPRFFPEDSSLQEIAKTEQIVQQLNRQARALKSQKSQGSLELKSRFRRDKFTFLQFFERPRKGRVTFLFPGINQLALLVIANDERLYVRDEANKKKGIYELTSDQLAKYLYLPLEIDELMLWTLGAQEVNGEVEHRRVNNISYLKIVSKKDREFMLTLEHLPGDSLQLKALRIDQAGEHLFDSSFVYFDERLPERIEFSLDSIEGVLRYSKLELNPNLDKELFTIE